MTLKHQKIISAGLIALVAYGGLYILAYIVNLNQPVIFLKAALLIYLYLSFKITLLYDLHFKNPGALERAQVRHESVPHWLSRGLKILGSAFVDRISHLLRGHQLLRFQNFLICARSLRTITCSAFLSAGEGVICLRIFPRKPNCAGITQGKAFP
jgi:hypothetical protein